MLESQHVYIDKIYNSVTSVTQVEAMCVYITVCSIKIVKIEIGC